MVGAGISLESDLATLLERQTVGRVLVVIDACFSGRVGIGSRTFLGPSLGNALSTFRGARVKLGGLDLGFGRAILCACRDYLLAGES